VGILDKDQLETQLIGFFKNYQLVQYGKGEFLFRPGDDFSSVYFVKSGYVRLFSYDQNGKEVTINIFKPVFFLSLYYALIGEKNHYFFEALTNVEAWKASKQGVFDFINNNLEVLRLLMGWLLITVSDLMKNVEMAISGDAYSKVATLIISLENYSHRKDGNNIEIKFATTHRLIASLTGLSRETASIQIKKLERKGYISQKKSLLVINDIEKMERDFAKD